MSRLIFDELGDILEREMQRQTASEIGKQFNRDRKSIYSMRDGCGFRCDFDFICGLRALGYDLVIQKKANDAPTQPEIGTPPRTRAIREILSLMKEDMLSSRDVVSMRTTFESATDELCRITDVFEMILPIMRARRGEIAGLQWSDVNFNDSTITIRHSLNYTADKGIFLDSTKTRSRRTVKIPPEVVSLLRQYRAEQSQYILSCCGQYDNQGFLFTQPDGKPSNPETITSWFCRFSKRYGLNGVHAHSFRHSAASLMIANGVDVVTVSSVLGHADPTTTERVYAHALEEVKVRASECLANAIYKRA